MVPIIHCLVDGLSETSIVAIWAHVSEEGGTKYNWTLSNILLGD